MEGQGKTHKILNWGCLFFLLPLRILNFNTKLKYIPEEPGIKSRGGYPNGLPAHLSQRYGKFLEDNVSIIVRDESNNNMICGIIVSTVVTR